MLQERLSVIVCYGKARSIDLYLQTECFKIYLFNYVFHFSRLIWCFSAMLCKRGLCRHAVSVCLSVRLSVTFMYSVEANKKKMYLPIFFHHRYPHHSSFSIPNVMAIFRRPPPPNGSVECRQSRQKSRF